MEIKPEAVFADYGGSTSAWIIDYLDRGGWFGALICSCGDFVSAHPTNGCLLQAPYFKAAVEAMRNGEQFWGDPRPELSWDFSWH